MPDKNRRPIGEQSRCSTSATEEEVTLGRPVLAFVLAVIALGAFVLARALTAVQHSPFNIYLPLLAILTLGSGRFAIKIPGRPATVSVSEVFVFASVILFGPAAATLTVAIDGLWTSFTQHHRRLHRALFNVTEPAISTWIAGQVFFAIARVPPLAQPSPGTPTLLLATIGMAAVFFILNSGLTAMAVALENGGSAYRFWKHHALYLAINYYAAASVGSLAVANASGLNLEVVGLVAPLLILSYVAYREGSGRIAEAEHHVREVEHLYQATVETLAIAVDSKDQVTHGHIRRVQRHTLAVATALGITDATELKALEAASLLHDVGKIAVPDYVLNKPGTLSPAEFEAIKIHAAEGAKILTAVGFPYPVVPVVRHHHERWDGRGYPDGLAGSAIPIGARILAVVDCFDALTSDRQYRRKLSDVDAIEILRERAGTFYDPAVVEAFFALIPALRDDDLVSLREEPLSIASAGGARVMLDRSPAVAAGYPDTPGLLMLRAVSARLVSRCADTVPDAEACLFAPDGTGDVLLVATATRRLGDAVDGLKFRIGEGLSGWVATNRRTVVNSDPTLDFGDLSARLGLRSCVSTPVFALGDLVGVLSVYSPKTRGFSESDARLVGGLAQEIGLAIARHGSERHHDGKYTATGSGLAAVS